LALLNILVGVLYHFWLVDVDKSVLILLLYITRLFIDKPSLGKVIKNKSVGNAVHNFSILKLI